MPRNRIKPLFSIPQTQMAGYETALHDYFRTYRSNLATFYAVNFATIHTFELGSVTFPAVFKLPDVLDAFDSFFKGDGTVNQKTYKQFLSLAGIVEDDRYAHQATSSRLQDDIIQAGLAVPYPSRRKIVVPDQEHIHSILCERLRMLSRSPDVCVSRFLPAFYSDIQEQLAAGSTQSKIATMLSSKTKRPVLQEDISRFLKRTNQVIMRYEQKKQRAIMTKDMAEQYVQSRIPTTTRRTPTEAD